MTKDLAVRQSAARRTPQCRGLHHATPMAIRKCCARQQR